MDGWRAHLNSLTWPEVARQLAVTAGLGRRRPKPKKEERAKIGQEGEDRVLDGSGKPALFSLIFACHLHVQPVGMPVRCWLLPQMLACSSSLLAHPECIATKCLC